MSGYMSQFKISQARKWNQRHALYPPTFTPASPKDAMRTSQPAARTSSASLSTMTWRRPCAYVGSVKLGRVLVDSSRGEYVALLVLGPLYGLGGENMG